LWFVRFIFNNFWLKANQKFVHLFRVVVGVNKTKKELAPLRTASFINFVLWIVHARANLRIPTFLFTTVLFMCFEITHGDNFGTFFAPDFQTIIYSFESYTGHGMNVVSASIGAVSE
jgi:hypothetical protein